VGRTRMRNEDHYAVLPHRRLYMVADGMGGVSGGDVASRMAVESVHQMLDDSETTWPSGYGPAERGSEIDHFIAGIRLANARIFTRGRREPALQGMGTTFAGVLFSGDQAVIAHVGDSRVYRLRGGRLELLTQDHSFLNDQIRAGNIAPEDAHTFPFKNILSRSVGPRAAVEVDTHVALVQPGDVYLLCSDGLCGVMDHHELTSILVQQPELCRAACTMIDRTNDLGGPDNITVVLVRVGDSAPISFGSRTLRGAAPGPSL
jgi:PPM family protein phosphatase